MAFCAFSGGNSLYGITPIENMFIIEFMPDAPAEYVKVYLYMLMLCSYPGECESIADVAAALKMDINTVSNALRHWEREGLIQKMSDNPPTYDFMLLSQREQKSDAPGDRMYENRSFNRELQSLMPGLVLDSHELRMVNDWQDMMKLDCGAILFMVEHELDKYRGKSLPSVQTVFKHLNATAMKWAENNIHTASEAREYCALETSYAKVATQVVRQFGQHRNPTFDETELVKKWTNDWRLSESDIISACAETVKSSSPSFAYLDKILESRSSGDDTETQRAGVKTICVHLGILSRPTPSQIDDYNSFLEMGFEPAAIEEAAKWCGQNNRRTFDDVRHKLEKWKSANAFTLADIEEERARQNHYVSIAGRIFEAAGIDRKITAADLKFAALWTALLNMETVLYAAQLSMGTATPMKYIDKLIREWSAKGINTPEKAREHSENHAAASAPDASKKPAMITRQVSEDDFGQDFYTDIMNRKRKGTEESD